MEQRPTTSYIKKIWQLEFGSSGLNQAVNEVFCHFLEFESQVFLENGSMIACDNVYQLVEVKSPEKNFGGPNGPKKVWFIIFFF